MTPKWGHSAFSALPKKQNIRISQRGSVLLPVVVAIALLAAITFMLSNQAVNQANIVSSELERDRLRYVAEAGIAHAKLQLSTNTSCDNFADIAKTDFAGESYTAQLSPKKGSPVRINASVEISDGKTLNLFSDDVPAYQSPSTVLLQLSKDAGKDVLIDSFYDMSNYGSVDDLTVRSDPGWTQRPLLEFDLSKIPAGVQIVSAILDLQLRTVSVPGVIGVHRMTRSWEEGTGKGTGNSDGASWLEYDGNNTWAQPGADFDSTLYATAAVNSAKNGQRVGWEIGDLVQGWVSGRFPNYGLALVGDGTVNNAEFESREEPDPAAAPRLTIVYACECGKVCAGATEAGKNVLLVVGDTANLTVEQQAKKTLMEGWGNTVSLIATSASQADFDTETANNDVVYVPELGSTPMSELGDKADNLAKGVITEESRKALLMGGFNLFPFVDADSISITDNSHYLTETLPIGNVQLSTVVQSFWVLKPTLATDLHVLGELNGSEPGLAYLDNGELRNDGSPAPARRVKLPWGAYNFDVNLLTDDGLEIMKRAIEWGATGALSGTFLDEFNAIAYDGNDGTLDWSDAWLETGETDGPTGGDFSVVSNSWCASGNCLQIREDRASSRQITREANLGGADTATLSISYRRRHVGSPTGGVITLEISANGGDTFTPLKIYQMDTQDSGQTIDTFDISPYIAANSQIRFSTSDVLYETAMYVDNVLIDTTSSPGNGFSVLMVVGDPSTLTTADDGRLQKMTEWGYTVTVFDDSESQSAFDAAVAANDVVFVTGSVGGGTLADKLTGATKGIVNEFYGKLDNFGFSSQTTAALSGIDTFTATAPAHEITSPFGGSAVTVFTTGLTMRVPSGTFAPDLVRVGDVSGTGALVTLEAGATRWDGSPAAARRVHLPFVEAETSELTIDGLDIMNRAIEWAADISGGGGGGGGGGGSCYADDFESGNYSGSTGSVNWTSSWVEFGDDNSATSGDERVQNESGDRSLRVRDNDGGGEGVYRDVDLSGFASATLSLEYRRHNLDTSSDWVVVQVSSDGGETWTLLGEFHGPGSDDAYQAYSHVIADPLTATSRIRLITSPTMGATDAVYFDNIEICE